MKRIIVLFYKTFCIWLSCDTFISSAIYHMTTLKKYILSVVSTISFAAGTGSPPEYRSIPTKQQDIHLQQYYLVQSCMLCCTVGQCR